jgi:hypothetical protein
VRKTADEYKTLGLTEVSRKGYKLPTFRKQHGNFLNWHAFIVV